MIPNMKKCAVWSQKSKKSVVDELEEVYKEASGFAVSDSIGEVWSMNKERHQFYSDQAKNSTLYVYVHATFETNFS